MNRSVKDFPDLGELVTVTGADGARVLVALRGGHVVSWRTADGQERLFLSERATTEGGAAIRGGIPVCFPQFAGLGSLRKHGFARISTWKRVGEASFTLESDPERWDGWPHRCSLMLDVLLGPATLTVALRVVNNDSQPLSFTGALHTYLACDDITAVSVSGLDGRSVHGGGTISGDITFGDGHHDVDLAVLDAQHAVIAQGLGRGASIVCAQTGFGDVVVWNVGEQLAASMSDLGPGQWRNFVCVEAAAVGTLVVDPNSSWTGSQTLVALP